MKKIILLYCLSICLISISFCQAQKQPSADEVMKKAYQEASEKNKKVFLMFHASWCGWCKKMDVAMNDTSCKKFFDDNFVIVHLVVDEFKDKDLLENAGASDLRDKYLGKNQGIPYWVILDRNAQVLADAHIRKEGASPNSMGQNIGCPATQAEVEAFIQILKKTTKLNTEELAIIAKRFRANENE